MFFSKKKHFLVLNLFANNDQVFAGLGACAVKLCSGLGSGLRA
jgi:hypothetical protein